eukprot:COSAG01_NODE_34478_length_547_cov_0.638393_1_plen_47_part_01
MPFAPWLRTNEEVISVLREFWELMQQVSAVLDGRPAATTQQPDDRSI